MFLLAPDVALVKGRSEGVDFKKMRQEVVSQVRMFRLIHSQQT